MTAPLAIRRSPSLGVPAVTVVHPSGCDVQALWKALATNTTGLSRNELEWCDLPCWIGTVPGADEGLPNALQQWDSRAHRLVWLALQDASFRSAIDGAIGRYGAHRVGIFIGTSTSGIRSTEEAYGVRRSSGQWPPAFCYRHTHSADSLGRFAAEILHILGPVAAVTTACSSSAKVFLAAQRFIRAGLIDAAVVGGSDSLCLSTLHGFASLQLLSEDICRPFDVDRKGISIGEAAGFALLDKAPSKISLVSGGESSDAWHMSTPHPEGVGARQAMVQAITAAGLTPAEIGYVNAHGTGTPANDGSEAAALRDVFGPLGVPVSSTKGLTGHTLGAAGIVEAIVTMLALEHQTLPGSPTLVSPDSTLGLDTVLQPRAERIRFAMSNSFGFGGSNCSLVFGMEGVQ